MNKNIRRILSAVLSLAMTLSLAACGEKNSSAQPGSTASDLEPVTLKLWSCSDKYAAQDESGIRIQTGAATAFTT